MSDINKFSTHVTKDDLAELAKDLRKRASACDALAEAQSALTSMARCEGKAQAYRHAAELVDGLLPSERVEANAKLAALVCEHVQDGPAASAVEVARLTARIHGATSKGEQIRRALDLLAFVKGAGDA